MDNEYYGAASTPTEDFLAHYGVRGMKWGVRKAIQSGNSAKLSKQYAKAEKKLAKLEKRAANASKYGKRAAALGAGAAVAGGLAAAGTSGVSRAIRAAGRLDNAVFKGVGNATERIGRGLVDSRINGKVGSALVTAGRGIRNTGKKLSNAGTGAAQAVSEWGRSTSGSNAIRNMISRPGGNGGANVTIGSSVRNGLNGVSNNTLARVGAAAVGAGLAAGAARNAYKAATAKKKAENFRNQMKTSFAGTQYANRIGSGSSSTASNKSKKRSKRS